MRQQRAGIRLPMKLPVLISWRTATGKYRQTQADTANLSGNGLLLLTPTRFRPQTPVRCRVFLPRAVTGVYVELICLGRVVRRSGTRETPAVAAIIDEYELRRAPEWGAPR
jgi:hypothetical protein